jgi:hypothetical protein
MTTMRSHQMGKSRAEARKKYQQSEKGQETRKKARKRFHEENKATENARSKQWYEDNKAKAAEDHKAYCEANRAQIRERKRKWQLSKNGRYSAYKNAAKARGFSFQLTKPEFLTLWGEPCHYCNTPIDGIGVDRVDSTQGYEVGNVVSCCVTCNRMKLDMSTQDFVTHLRRILTHIE